jgi:hypothetical protein
MNMRELKFINSDATPKETVLHVDTASIEPIMAWYGAYFARDRYRVLVDGVKVEKDQNGELEGDVPPVPDGFDPAVEAEAQRIYEAMEYGGPPNTSKPAWTPRGNSLKQDEARRLARAARSCTCPPDDNPPVPCARRYALGECLAAAVATQA